MKHTAKRNDTGEYEYRGHRILDLAGGRSLHDRLLRNSDRWVIQRIVLGESHFGWKVVGRSYTYADAKRKVDRLLEKEVA